MLSDPSTPHRLTLRLTGAIFCSTALLLSACSKPPAAQQAPARPAPMVAVAIAITRDVPVYIDTIGKCESRETVLIQPQISGQITQIHFTDGASVKVGDLLYSIDRRPFQITLEQTQASLAQNKANLDFAKQEFARIEGLLARNAASQQDFDTKKNAVDVAQSQVTWNEAAVALAKLNLEYCSIRSPIEGRAGQRLVDSGNIVKANDTALLGIDRLDPIYAEFTIPENDLSDVQKNMAKGTLKVQVHLPDDGDEPRSGDLTFIDNNIQDRTGTVKLRATLSNTDHHFWPGRFVKVRLILNMIPGAVLVPAEAPQNSATGLFVFVIKPDNTAEMHPVTLGQRHGDLVVVTGINAGDRVVIAGQMMVAPGGQVRVEGAPPPASAPAAAQVPGKASGASAGGVQ